MGIIYSYTNKTNNKIYIGQTINPIKRKYNHEYVSQNKNACDYDTPFHRAIRKYGFENFEYRVLADEIDDKDLLNQLEKYYIKKFDSLIPNGYNVSEGGDNAPHDWTDEQKINYSLRKGELTEEEVISLRVAYRNHESPIKIYEEKYKNKMHRNSFMNIWTGKRYSLIMPEVFEDRGRHTKLTAEIVKKIREDREKYNLSYAKLSEKYNISKSTIADVITNRTWKNV